MDKIDGSRFLQNYFPDFANQTIVLEDVSYMTKDYLLSRKKYPNGFWQVRCANPNKNEMRLPYVELKEEEEVLIYLRSEKLMHPEYTFILCNLDSTYKKYVFSGQIAVLSFPFSNDIIIDIQENNKKGDDIYNTSSFRIRDVEVSATLYYKFLNKIPKVYNYKGIDLDKIKYHIWKLFDIPVKIHSLYYENSINTISYTKFKLYMNDRIVLSDHRTIDSFYSVIMENKNETRLCF